jgi:hypothetical protein
MIVGSKKADSGLSMFSPSPTRRRSTRSSFPALNREAEAQAEAAEAMRLNPQASLERVRKIFPFKDPEMLERFLAALRQAGLK